MFDSTSRYAAVEDARYLGDPTQFWKLCDAAGVLDPEELEQPGATVEIRLEVPG
jgi:hypothetical protein